MTQQVDCTEAVAALLGVVEKGGSMTEEKREHLRTCERCKELLASAREFQTALTEETAAAPEVHPDAAALEREVAAKRRRDIMARAIIAASGIALFAAVFFLSRDDGVPPKDTFLAMLAAAALTVMVVLVIALPVLLLVHVIRGVTTTKDGRRVYRRLGPGRQISGVCLGLSESFNIRVGVLRLLFVVALFFDGLGLLVYILFALVMPVHPDDRQYMLRFRLRRAFGGNR